jgi:hypothetical protein
VINNEELIFPLKDQDAEPTAPLLSLVELTEQEGTAGLYERTLSALESVDLLNDPRIRFAMSAGFQLHSKQERTDGLYSDHLMRVAIRLIEDLGITDPDVIAAAFLHDAVEDHPRDLVKLITGEDIHGLSEEDARDKAYFALDSILPKSAGTVMIVTNPILQKGQSKLKVYTEHTEALIEFSPKGRALKLADFIDNAVNNHTTRDPLKQMKLDLKYVEQYKAHIRGISLPDSIIPEAKRPALIAMLGEGLYRAEERLRQYQEFHPEEYAATKRRLLGESLGQKALRVSGVTLQQTIEQIKSHSRGTDSSPHDDR